MALGLDVGISKPRYRPSFDSPDACERATVLSGDQPSLLEVTSHPLLET